MRGVQRPSTGLLLVNSRHRYVIPITVWAEVKMYKYHLNHRMTPKSLMSMIEAEILAVIDTSWVGIMPR